MTSTDSDGDSICFPMNGLTPLDSATDDNLVTDTTDVFLTGGLRKRSWSCEVTAYDGLDYSSSVTDTAYVENLVELDLWVE